MASCNVLFILTSEQENIIDIIENIFLSVICATVVLLKDQPDKLDFAPHVHQWFLDAHNPVTDLLVVLTVHGLFLLGTNHCMPAYPSRPAILEMLWPSNLATTIWSFSKSLKSLHVPIFPASNPSSSELLTCLIFSTHWLVLLLWDNQC